jgi:uncharacterized protein (DUF927 family)
MSPRDVKATLDAAKALPADTPGATEPEPNEKWPFRLTKRGVEWRRVRGSGSSAKVEWVWLCTRLEVLAFLRDHDSAGWGRLLAVTDHDGNVHECPMPMEALAGSGEECRRELFRLGLDLAPGKAYQTALHEYIITACPKARVRCVSRIGWHENRFVLPDDTLGPDATGERVILQTTGSLDHSYKCAGTLEDWRDTVSAPAVGNSRLLFYASAAFAGPMIHIVGAEGGGFHLRGGSSTGKSTALALASSVWGGGGRGYIRQWRATDNALESLAAIHSDTMLALDELGQVDPKAAGAAAYMLANGLGKARASRDGSSRRPQYWRCLFLSTGEIGLADKVAESGQRMAAGMAVRVVDVRADAGAGFGLFEELHGEENPATLAQRIKHHSERLYGTAGRAFVSKVAEDPGRVREAIDGMRAMFIREAVPSGADGQVRRVAERFALIAAAGELARELEIVAWPEGAAYDAARRCFADWLAERGGAAAAEVTDAINRLRGFLEAHGESRFVSWRRDPRRAIVPNKAGYVQFAEIDPSTGAPSEPPAYFIQTSTWQEIFAGLDLRTVNAALVDRGMVLPGKDGKASSVHSPPAHGSSLRLYRINPEFLGG